MASRLAMTMTTAITTVRPITTKGTEVFPGWLNAAQARVFGRPASTAIDLIASGPSTRSSLSKGDACDQYRLV